MNKIIYLDAAATALKPKVVINKETDFLKNDYANSGRGICPRVAAVDKMLLETRKKVADFMGAETSNQVIFTSGATDGLNRIAQILKTNKKIKNGTTVAVSDLDHHSARLPWEALIESGINILTMPLNDKYDFVLDEIPQADVMIITAMSNVIGMPVDVRSVIQSARKKNPNVITVVDAAQFVVHKKIDVKDWDADFVCFSAHKIGADTGLGIMYIKNPDDLLPDKFGGGMVNAVIDKDRFSINATPDKFEAGTLPITQIAGLGVAVEYIEKNRPDLNLIKYLYDELSKNSRIKIITQRDATLLTFTIDGMHVLDFGALTGTAGVCLRVGNMCAGWIHNLLGIKGSARISVGFWNTMEEMQQVLDLINSIVK